MNRDDGQAPFCATLPDWQPDFERLRRETRMAQESHISDPWTRVEAECWLALIDAEIAAQAPFSDGGALPTLRRWKAELGALIRTLRALERGPDTAVRPPAEQTLAA